MLFNLSTRKSIIISHLGAIIGIFLWFSPYTQNFFQNIDNYIFNLLNKSLVEPNGWQYFWGMMNHRREVWLNIVGVLGINIYFIINCKMQSRKHLILNTLYFIAFLEIAIYTQRWLTENILHVMRHGPTSILPAHVLLSEALNNPMIKDNAGSYSCFPAGHAFSLIYWACYTAYCYRKPAGIIAISFALFLCLPRIFSGAHWFSDILLSGFLAWVWICWAIQLRKYILKLTDAR